MTVTENRQRTGDDYWLGVHTDELGVQTVVKHELVVQPRSG